MRTMIWAAAFALAATSAYASPGFGGARLSSSNDNERQEAPSGGAIGAVQKIAGFFLSLGQVTLSPAPRLPDERQPAPKKGDCKEDAEDAPEKQAAEKRKPAAPSELLFLAF